MQLLAKFKKILYMGFGAALNFRKFKVALNPMNSLYANLGLKVEFSAWLTERKTRAVKQALKAAWKSSALVKKRHLPDNRFEIEQSFQGSCEFKLNEGMTPAFIKIGAFILNT